MFGCDNEREIERLFQFRFTRVRIVFRGGMANYRIFRMKMIVKMLALVSTTAQTEKIQSGCGAVCTSEKCSTIELALC